MPAGANLRISVWRMTTTTDDYAGGAVITGTVVYNDLLARMQGNEDDQLLVQQGLETLRTFNMEVWPGNKDIRERDEVEITFPPNYPYINQRFRITSVRYSDFNDPRAYMLLGIQRSLRSHVEQ